MQKQEYLYKSSNHAANLNDMRLKDKYCDVTIKIDEKEVRAHKVILAANLKYFETMFSSDSFQESQGGVITMKSVEEADLELFISYAYTGEILLTESNALNLLELANYLSEDGIKEACIEFLEKNLKAEEACRAYKFANTIECLSLKNAAKSKIITNFGDCSESAEYLNFDFGSLTDILSDGKAQLIQMRKMFFEGMLRWIMHDAKERKMYMEDLLSSIDISTLKAGVVMRCLYRNLVLRDDEYGIIKDIIICYEANKIEREKHEQVLILINRAAPFAFQFYDFVEKKWSLQQEIPNSATNFSEYSAIFNDKLYFMNKNSEGNQLQMFDSSSKQITILHSSSSISNYATLCTCSRFLYICGGVKQDSTRSKQILKYDPQSNSFESLTLMTRERSSAAVIFYQDCLFVLGGYNGISNLQLVEKYDLVRNEWTTLASMCVKRRGHATAILDGKLYACGGFNIDPSVEVYDSAKNSWQLVASMNKRRGFFLVVTHKDKLLAIGGAEDKTVEVYDPTKNQWQINEEMSSGLQVEYCVGGLIPYSCIIDE